MLVLFETPVGYSLFKCCNDDKLEQTDVDDVYDTFFNSPDNANKFLRLVSFQPFADTAHAVQAATSCIEGTLSSPLKSFLKRQFKNTSSSSTSLAVADSKLGASIKESLLRVGGGNSDDDDGNGLSIVHNAKTFELFRGIRMHLEELLAEAQQDDDTSSATSAGGVTSQDLRSMQLGLSHSLGRYKLKFSADKVDTMVVQAVGLLDELDKEINTYAMRVREWYGWHFPELQRLVESNVQYCQLVLTCGFRNEFHNHDLSSVIADEVTEAAIKEAAQVSMGTEIAQLDIVHIQSLAEQVLSMTEYRSQLYEYLKNRMNAIAPNLTILVGELVGARLIAHAGSLLNLAKYPASTVQILGAEKALFRALKTKHDTPKYGLIYHASLVGQASPKNKGKISRVLAAKAALGIRVDALTVDETTDNTTDVDTTIGFEGRSKVEARLRQLEGGGSGTVITNGGDNNLTAKKTARYSPVVAKTAATSVEYKNGSEMILDATTTATTKQNTTMTTEEKKKAKKEKKTKKKRKAVDVVDGDDNDKAAEKAAKKAAKKAKKEKRKSSSSKES